MYVYMCMYVYVMRVYAHVCACVCMCVLACVNVCLSVCLLSLDKNDQAGGPETYFKLCLALVSNQLTYAQTFVKSIDKRLKGFVITSCSKSLSAE